MDAENEPGPGRSTQERAFSQLTKEIGQRNDQAQKAARALRAKRDKEMLAKRRKDDERG